MNVYFRNEVCNTCVANTLTQNSYGKVFRNESKHFRKYIWLLSLQSKKSLSCFKQHE